MNKKKFLLSVMLSLGVLAPLTSCGEEDIPTPSAPITPNTPSTGDDDSSPTTPVTPVDPALLNKKNEANSYLDSIDLTPYRVQEASILKGLIKNARSDIDASTSVDEIDKIIADFKISMGDLKTDQQLTNIEKDELERKRISQKNYVQNYYDYSNDNKYQYPENYNIFTAQEKAIMLITNATSISIINDAVLEFENTYKAQKSITAKLDELNAKYNVEIDGTTYSFDHLKNDYIAICHNYGRGSYNNILDPNDPNNRYTNKTDLDNLEQTFESNVNTINLTDVNDSDKEGMNAVISFYATFVSAADQIPTDEELRFESERNRILAKISSHVASDYIVSDQSDVNSITSTYTDKVRSAKRSYELVKYESEFDDLISTKLTVAELNIYKNNVIKELDIYEAELIGNLEQANKDILTNNLAQAKTDINSATDKTQVDAAAILYKNAVDRLCSADKIQKQREISQDEADEYLKDEIDKLDPVNNKSQVDAIALAKQKFGAAISSASSTVDSIKKDLRTYKNTIDSILHPSATILYPEISTFTGRDITSLDSFNRIGLPIIEFVSAVNCRIGVNNSFNLDYLVLASDTQAGILEIRATKEIKELFISAGRWSTNQSSCNGSIFVNDFEGKTFNSYVKNPEKEEATASSFSEISYKFNDPLPIGTTISIRATQKLIIKSIGVIYKD